MICLRSETEEVTVSAIMTEPNRRGNCRACAKETGYNKAQKHSWQRPYKRFHHRYHRTVASSLYYLMIESPNIKFLGKCD